MENISPSSLRLSTMTFDNVFDNIFTNIERERKNRIKKLEKLRERRYYDSKSVRKIGVKGDFSYLDEYGKRLEEDMAAFKEITRQREEQETNWTDRPLSPLPPLFDNIPVRSPNLSYRLIGNEDYKASRMATMSEMGLNGAMQELYGVESNPYCVPGPEGAAIAAERLSQINERIAKLKVRATEIQQGIHSHMNAGVSDIANSESEQFTSEINITQDEVNGITDTESEQFNTPEIKVTQEDEDEEVKE